MTVRARRAAGPRRDPPHTTDGIRIADDYRNDQRRSDTTAGTGAGSEEANEAPPAYS